jgi:AcrR family transcriptional regulator
MTASAAATDSKTAKFQVRRDRLIDAAATLINQHGLKGMTFANVAALVDMNQNSIAYYFKRKEMLAHAAYVETLERIAAKVAEAASRPDPRARLAHYLHLVFVSQRRLLLKEDRPMTVLTGMSSLPEPYRSEAGALYQSVLRGMRDWFGPTTSRAEVAVNTARAHVVLESVLWLPVWLRLHALEEFDRVERRMLELWERGVAPKDSPLATMSFSPAPLETGRSEVDGDAFLRAATRLINRDGYRGASVDRIASELNVTKGSFYHHLERKDDLVLACFRRSYDTIARAQDDAQAAGGTMWNRLSRAITALIDVQFSSDGPLMRTTALAALPAEHRGEVIAQSNILARRFAGMIIDGITEGSINAVDPLIASQWLMSMLNRAVDLHDWAERLGRERSVATYATIFAHGLLSDTAHAA